MNYQLTNTTLAGYIAQTRRNECEARAAQHRLALESHGLKGRSDSRRAVGVSLALLVPAASVWLALIR